MCGRIPPPPEIERLFERAGRTWSPSERLSVQELLNSESRLAYLLRFVALHLGSGTTFQDAEDTWQKFNIYYSEKHKRWISPLHNVMEGYDPEKGDFCGFLLTSLKRFCWDEGQRIRRDDQDPPLIGEWLPDDPSGPEGDLGARQEKEALQKKIQAAIEALPENQRTVIIMFYFLGMSVEEIAKALKRSIPWVKVNLYRGRQNLKGLLGGGDSS